MLHMINYFENNLKATGTTYFPNVGQVRTVKFKCDVTVLYTNDSLHNLLLDSDIASDQ